MDACNSKKVFALRSKMKNLITECNTSDVYFSKKAKFSKSNSSFSNVRQKLFWNFAFFEKKNLTCCTLWSMFRQWHVIEKGILQCRMILVRFNINTQLSVPGWSRNWPSFLLYPLPASLYLSACSSLYRAVGRSCNEQVFWRHLG